MITLAQKRASTVSKIVSKSVRSVLVRVVTVLV